MKGKLPFPKWILNADVQIFTSELGENGGPIEAPLYSGKCNYTEKTRHVLDKERKLITLTGKVIVEGDINPGKLIEGYVLIGTIRKDIHNCLKPRNPDGSVFSTELDLI